MEAFIDWTLPHISLIIGGIFILVFAVSILAVIRRLTAGYVSKSACIVQTIRFIRSARQTGKEEAGNWEAAATVRIPNNGAEDTVISRTLYLNHKLLKHMIPGKYIDISVVPGKEDFFGVVADIAVKVGR